MKNYPFIVHWSDSTTSQHYAMSVKEAYIVAVADKILRAQHCQVLKIVDENGKTFHVSILIEQV